MTTAKTISGSTLKMTAMAAMLLDHIAAVFLGAFPIPYYALRLIGRIAFPIFCFLLAEGFFHTKNLRKYGIRLALFALASEIPFDLAFRRALIDGRSQNVFFTLFIGLCMMASMEYAKRYERNAVCRAAILAGCMALAFALHTDYGAIGILSIAILYELREKKSLAAACACIALCYLSDLQIAALASVPLIMRYNGRRGLPLKYSFYLFYPLHLLLLYAIFRCLI